MVMIARNRPARVGASVAGLAILLVACAPARGSTSPSTDTRAAVTPVAQPANPDPAEGAIARTTTTTRPPTTTQGSTSSTAPATTAETFPIPALGDLGFGKDLANLVPVTIDPRVTDPHLFLLGDSVMAALAPRYTDQGRAVLEPLGWNLTLDAEVSRSPLGALQVLKKRQRDIADVVVILIGHNYGGNLKVVTQQFHDIMSQLTRPKKIVFLLNEEFKASIGDVNNVIRDLAAADPRISIVDWNTLSQGPGFRGPDRIHLTPLGAKLLAVVVAEAVGAAPR